MKLITSIFLATLALLATPATATNMTKQTDTSCLNIGDQCTDGTIYAGNHPHLLTPLFLHPHDQSTQATWGIATDTKATDTIDGKNNLEWIKNHAPAWTEQTSNESNIKHYLAFKLCEDLNIAAEFGHTDWYLPSKEELHYLSSKEELHYLWSVQDKINAGAGTPFAQNSYWSSTQQNQHTAWFQNFSDGTLLDYEKDANLHIRCIRKNQ
jgi:hypothetical protein